MSDERNAVFLSYASQDADPARRICEALRAAGVEVWFDQSELRGGDAWDAKIRKQIKECALFVPIISANTQARLEGYFRLEWKLAEDRSHLMAKGKPFIVPVTVDGTSERDAHVPDSFLAVQWTRIASGDSLRAFGERAGKLLANRAGSNGPSDFNPELHTRNSRLNPTSSDLGRPEGRRKRIWIWGSVAAAALAAGIAVLKPRTETPAPNPTRQTPNSEPRDLANAKSLVVLPLENLSPDPENAFFTDGMHSEIISTLGRIPDLKVISRASALMFKGSTAPLADIAEKLGVANVITGSVNRAGNRARVTLELRRASDESLLWSKSYNRELKDQIAIQTDIAEELGRILQARAAEGTSTNARFFTRNPRAYDLFLKAKALYFSAKPGSMDQVVTLLTEALQLDPEFFTAAFQLSAAQCNRFYDETDPVKRTAAAAEAKRWAEEASRLMPGGVGDNALVFYLFYVEKDNARALELVQRTLRALPNEAATPAFAGFALDGLGRLGEGLEFHQRALQLDPLNLFNVLNATRALVELHRADEAGAAMDRALALGDDYVNNRFFAQIRFQFNGEVPALRTDMSPVERVTWLWRARRFGEIAPVVEAELSHAGTNDVVRFELRLRQHDAARRLANESVVGGIHRELLEIARRLQGAPEVGPSEKAGWMLRALIRNGQDAEGIAAGRRYVEAASATVQVKLRWQREIVLAENYAYLQRSNECMEILGKLLEVPSGLTVPMLRVDPAWDNVREHPRFKALLADPKNSAPLF